MESFNAGGGVREPHRGDTAREKSIKIMWNSNSHRGVRALDGVKTKYMNYLNIA